VLRTGAFLFLTAIASCSANDGDRPEPPPKVVVDDCAGAELAVVGGGCRKVGVRDCGPGFSFDEDRGCNAILPEVRCAAGTLAVPGDASCRQVAACGEGAWGSIPVGAGTHYVDASYSGGGSDGSATRPFTTIQAAIDAAPPEALIAIAEGTYSENLVVNRPMRIWGRCPEKVTIAGSGTFAVDITAITELRSVSVTGPDVAVGVAGTSALLDRVVIKNAGDRGLDVEDVGGATEVTLRDSLIENTAQIGIYSEGSTVAVERSVVRGTRGSKKGQPTDGVLARAGAATHVPSRLRVSSSLIDDNTIFGVNVVDSIGVISGSVVRGTRRTTASPAAGLTIQKLEEAETPSLTVRQSLFDLNQGIGIDVASSSAAIEAVTVRDITGAGAGGMLLELADAKIENTTIVDVVGTALAVESSMATVAGVRVARVQFDEAGSVGPGIQIGNTKGPVSSVSLRDTLVQDVIAAGIGVWGSRVTMTDVGIRNVKQPADGRFGDGITLTSSDFEGRLDVVDARITRVVVRDAARAAITLFGGTLRLGEAVLCSPIAINTETLYAVDASGEVYRNPIVLEDLGGSVCGCAAPARCGAQSSGLVPIIR